MNSQTNSNAVSSPRRNMDFTNLSHKSQKVTNKRLAGVHQRLNNIQNEIKFIMQEGNEQNENANMMASMASEGEGNSKYRSQMQYTENST